MENTISGGKLLVLKGSKDLGIFKGTLLNVRSVEILGFDYSHKVKIVVEYRGRILGLYARHVNRLSDPIFTLNNGDPTKAIKVAKANP